MLKNLLIGLFVAGVMVCRADSCYLEAVVEAQVKANVLLEQAETAEQCRFFDVIDKPKIIDISALEKPCILIVSGSRSEALASGRTFNATDNLMLLDLRKQWYKVFTIPLHWSEIDAIKIDPWKKHQKVWLGEEEVIRRLAKQYAVPDFDVHAKTWHEALKTLTKAEQFNEMRLWSARAFPETPAEVATVYARACSKLSRKTAAEYSVEEWADVEAVRRIYQRDCYLVEQEQRVRQLNPADVQLALNDMEKKFPEAGLKERYDALVAGLADRKASALQQLGDPEGVQTAEKLLADAREVLLANPLMDDMELIAVRRNSGYFNLRDHGHTVAFQGFRHGFGKYGSALGIPMLSTHSILTTLNQGKTWNCDLVKITNLRGDAKLTPVFKDNAPEDLISNARVHWDGNRVAFTMGSKKKPMGLYELDLETGKTKQLSEEGSNDHFVDSCYLPDGNVIVMSTAIMTGLPCEGGSHLLANMYLLNPETGKMRQLGVDQENSYHATVMEDGKVMYIRYEYTDTPHYFVRILMTMNPDGTNQREMYGSNSHWPTSMFYPQPIPGKPEMFSAVVSGHHGPSHMGRLVLFNTDNGRREADGAVQFIGDKNKPVEAQVVDHLYGGDFPKYMYSVPLDTEYYLTMLKPAPLAPWGLYLVDAFDNKTLIHQPKEDFLAWPQVLKKKEAPPAIPSRVDEASKTSHIYVQDIYAGPGLEGIPRGTVKEMAIYAFHYGYKGAAHYAYIGIEGPWDARYMLGTVPVNEDGSVFFEVPAMMPISLLPLDADGAAVQRMRSWINPQPGEVLSCIGCHETVDQAPINRATQAMKKAPEKIRPWYGKARPYSFMLEVQPVLDKYCISCHSGKKAEPNLTSNFSKNDLLHSKSYAQSYVALQKYVRRQGPEGDYRLPLATEWHVSSSKLMQMLKKGHHGVVLDDEARRRLTMWIDLNVPFHAAFHPRHYGSYGDQIAWRRENLKKYANLDWDPENDYKALVMAAPAQPEAIMPQPPKKADPAPKIDGWPFSAETAGNMQREAGEKLVLEFGEPGRNFNSYYRSRRVSKKLNGKERIEMLRIPAGRYVSGAGNIVEVKKPFWMSKSEISNTQLQSLMPGHDSRFADQPGKDQSSRGMGLYGEKQPAVRVSYDQAQEFCKKLSEATGKAVTLPSADQWEWAARAGSATSTWYNQADFSPYANLSDISHKNGCNRAVAPYFLSENSVNDRNRATAEVMKYRPNPWGLHDMIGNAEEWTATEQNGKQVVKGGSWFDMPRDATAGTSWAYAPYIRLPDLGFRIIIHD